MGTKRLSLGKNRLGTKDPWVRNARLHTPGETTPGEQDIGRNDRNSFFRSLLIQLIQRIQAGSSFRLLAFKTFFFISALQLIFLMLYNMVNAMLQGHGCL